MYGYYAALTIFLVLTIYRVGMLFALENVPGECYTFRNVEGNDGRLAYTVLVSM